MSNDKKESLDNYDKNLKIDIDNYIETKKKDVIKDIDNYVETKKKDVVKDIEKYVETKNNDFINYILNLLQEDGPKEEKDNCEKHDNGYLGKKREKQPQNEEIMENPEDYQGENEKKEQKK